VDYDGQYSYSDVTSVLFESEDGIITLYPNPASTEVTLTVTEPTEVTASNILGKVLLKQTLNKENSVVDLSNFPNGILIFKLGKQIQRIVKQ
jgi:hypothetical protein